LKRELKRTLGESASALEMDLLIREILFCFFRLNATGNQLFAGSGLTPGQVSLMRSLLDEGPQSVAQIARSRPVARQGVQRMADQLAVGGLLEFVENPSHRRAKLARLTARGERVINHAIAEELKWAGNIARRFDAREVMVARKLIRRLMEMLPGAAENLESLPRRASGSVAKRL